MSTRAPGIRRPRCPRAAAAAAASGLAAAALAGCGSAVAPGGRSGAAGYPAGTGQPGSAGTPAQAAGPPACTPAGLRVRLDTAAAGAAAGTSYVPLEFTNTSPRACQLAGYPAVAFTSGARGHQIGVEAAVDRSAKVTAVLLAPGGTAHAWLGISSVASYPARQCRPVTAAGLRVVVPGAESSSFLADRVPACKNLVSGADILIVRPVQPGVARRGTA